MALRKTKNGGEVIPGSLLCCRCGWFLKGSCGVWVSDGLEAFRLAPRNPPCPREAWKVQQQVRSVVEVLRR